jgi:hypothetical protein
MPAATTKVSAKAKARRQAIAAIRIPLQPPESTNARAWLKRTEAAHLLPRQAIRYADNWLPTAKKAWLAAAGELGFEQSAHWASPPSNGNYVFVMASILGEQFLVSLEITPREATLVTAYLFTSTPDGGRHTKPTASQLTYEELVANVPCRGCGRPWQGGPSLPAGTNNYTDKDRAAAAAEDAEFKRLHPDCHAGRQSISRSGINHCLACCPTPPMSMQTLENVTAIFRSSSRSIEEGWRRAAGPKSRPSKVAAASKPTRAQLERRLAEAESELARLKES